MVFKTIKNQPDKARIVEYLVIKIHLLSCPLSKQGSDQLIHKKGSRLFTVHTLLP